MAESTTAASRVASSRLPHGHFPSTRLDFTEFRFPIAASRPIHCTALRSTRVLFRVASAPIRERALQGSPYVASPLLSSPLLAVRPVAPSAFCRSAPQRTDAMRCDTMRCEWSTSASLLGTRSRSRNVCHIPSSSTVWWYFEQLLWIWIDCYKLVTEKKRHDCYWDVINAKSAKIEKRKVEWRVDDR